MSVALRCPVCGTTQAHPGECDACSDAEVRYFCSDHEPGLWLDAPVCTACGARFGEAPKRREPSRRSPTVSEPETRRTESRPPVRRRRDPTLRRTAPERPLPRVEDPEETPAEPSVADLLARMAEEVERRRYRVEEMPRGGPPVEGPGKSVPVVGCLLRLVVLVLVLIALAVAGLFVLFGGM